jgi:hypothetical protein
VYGLDNDCYAIWFNYRDKLRPLMV